MKKFIIVLTLLLAATFAIFGLAFDAPLMEFSESPMIFSTSPTVATVGISDEVIKVLRQQGVSPGTQPIIIEAVEYVGFVSTPILRHTAIWLHSKNYRLYKTSVFIGIEGGVAVRLKYLGSKGIALL